MELESANRQARRINQHADRLTLTLFVVFCDEFTRRMNERRMEAHTNINAAKSEVPRTERDLERLVDRFLKDDGAADALHVRMKQLEVRKRELQEFLASAEEPPPILHPSMSVIYRERVAALHGALQKDDTRAQAAEVIRSLVSEIVLTPEGDALQIDVRGDLGGILTVASAGNQKSPRSVEAGFGVGSQVMMVAGIGFEPMTFRL